MMEAREGAGLAETSASSLRSSSVRKGLMFCGFIARESVRENPVHRSGGWEGDRTGGSRCTGGRGRIKS